MIIVRNWRKWNYKTHKPIDYKGVFLFGFIPLFIRVYKFVELSED